MSLELLEIQIKVTRYQIIFSGASKKYGVSSALIYQWQEKFLEGAREGLERRKHGTSSAEQRKIDQLSKDNDRMKDVIAEITAENISFKKSFGDL